jgi:flagellin-specific chaperone FliS
LIKEVAP